MNRQTTEHTASLLRRSVASHLTLQYVAQSMHSHLQDFVRRLSDTDPDTACAVLTFLSTSILSQGCILEGMPLLYETLQNSVYAKVRRSATEVYLYMLDNAQTVHESENLEKHTRPSELALESLIQWTPDDTTTEPGAVNLDLRMRGYNLFAICCNSHSITEEAEVRISHWVRMLRIAGNARSVCSPRRLPYVCELILIRISWHASPPYVR